MKLRPLSLLFAALSSMIASAAELKLPDKKDFHLFLLAGQSNMAGRGKIDAKASEADPRILAINKRNEWQVALDPLHWDKPAAGTGIGRPFAAIIAGKNPGTTVGLIPTACGGSPISTWKPGQHWAQTKSHPWDDSIARAKLAMKSGTLKAILWHQGESDSNAEMAPEHGKNLEDLITRFRKELDAPDLPFIIGQLGRFPAKPWNKHREAVDAAQREVAAKVKNVRFVEIPDPESIGDHLHFDTPTLRRFAEGYAAAYFEITGGKP
jgi:hypothetical protein